jgi:hypothetical protein
MTPSGQLIAAVRLTGALAKYQTAYEAVGVLGECGGSSILCAEKGNLLALASDCYA